MAKTFAEKNFISRIGVSTLAALVEYLVWLSSSLIAGNMLGEEVLSAITLVEPFFSLIFFAGSLVSMGSSIIFSYEVGKGQRDTAILYFSQGAILIICVGIILTMLYLSIYFFIPNIFNVPEIINLYIHDYLWYSCFMPLPMLLSFYLYNIIIIDGGELFCCISSIVQIISNVCLSVIFCWKMGVGGISLGILISNIVVLCVLGTFFLSKRNALSFRYFLSITSIILMIKYSIVGAGNFLFVGTMQLLFNFFLLHYFGTDAVIIFTVIFNIIMLSIACFESIGEAIKPLVIIYLGEGGQKGIIKTMCIAAKTAIIEGICITIFLWIFADTIPHFFGITTRTLVDQSAEAIKIFSFSACAVALTFLLSSYYLYMNRIGFSVSIIACYILIFPLVAGVILGRGFGLIGVWYAFMLSGFFTLTACLAYVHFWSKEKYFPLLLDKSRLSREISYDAPRTKEGIMNLVYRVEHDLCAAGVDRKKIVKIMLLIEETEMLNSDDCGEENTIIECTILIDNTISVILRDSDKKQFVMNEDAQIKSFRSYVYSRLIASQKEKQYILTGGKNRIIYKLDS